MRAVVVPQWMEPSELSVSEVPEPAVQPGRLGIDVAAAGCNFFDTLIVRGRYQLRPEFPFTPGGEVAGSICAVGDGITGFEIGDRVMAILPHGGYAERVNVVPHAAYPIPDAMSFEEAAAFPMVYGTSYVSVVQRGGIRPGETLLVTAAAGGIGLAAVQIGKAVGARVIALAGGDEKLEIVRRAGADLAIDYRKEDWTARVRDWTEGRGADVIIENVGGEIFEGCMRCLAWGGRLVVVGFAGGEIPTVKTNRILLKHISLVGVHFGPMLDHEPEALEQAYRELFELYGSGRLEPLIWRTYPLEELPDALEALAGRASWGKIVITLGGADTQVSRSRV